MCKGLFILFFENRQGRIGVGKRLEIRQISIGLPASLGVEPDAGLNLLKEAFPFRVPGMEGRIVTEGTPAKT